MGPHNSAVCDEEKKEISTVPMGLPLHKGWFMVQSLLSLLATQGLAAAALFTPILLWEAASQLGQPQTPTRGCSLPARNQHFSLSPNRFFQSPSLEQAGVQAAPSPGPIGGKQPPWGGGFWGVSPPSRLRCSSQTHLSPFLATFPSRLAALSKASPGSS